MTELPGFGTWLKQRRRTLDLTQAALAERVFCSVETIKKMESGERAPSQELAGLLADVLGVRPGEREAFVRFARTRDANADPGAFASGDARAKAWRVPASAYHLPRPLTGLVGRERELKALADLLRRPSTALITLSGPPGAGKTRLSLAVAEAIQHDYADGVCFVPLAAIHDPALVLNAIASALGVRENAPQSLLATTQAYLESKRLLLVLDNFEQVVAAAPVVAELLAAGRDVQAIVSSREVLKIYGEQEFPVPPLTLPDIHHLPAVTALTMYSSVDLFVQRAQAVRANFTLSAENAEAVAQICAWLDGLPLAIEMAAAQVKWHAPQVLLAQLSRRLSLLVGGPRDLTPRQQTLRGAIDWSYDLLSAAEQRVFNHLAVFEGGCTLDAVTAVTAEPSALSTAPAILGTLQALAEKSLIKVDTGDGETRYTVLQTIREYAWEHLTAGGELAAAQQRHAQYFLRMAEESELELYGADQIGWLNRLDRENGNLRAAMQWAAQSGAVITALRLASAPLYFWIVRGRLSEAQGQLRQALAQPGAEVRNAARAHALSAEGYLFWMLGRFSDARRLLAEALDIGRELNDEPIRANALRRLGWVATYQGNYAEARAHLEEALALSRALDDLQGTGWTLVVLGDLALREGHSERAQNAYTGGVEYLRRTNNRDLLAFPLRRLGYIALQQGDREQAASLCRESITLNLETNDQHGAAACLILWARICSARGQAETGARLCGVVGAFLDKDGSKLVSADQLEYERTLALLRAELGEPAFERARSEGQVTPFAEAVEGVQAGDKVNGY